MSQTHVDAFPTRSIERAGRVARLARWFRPQEVRERADRRDRAAMDAHRIGEIKWLWRQACEVTGLGRLIFTPSGPTMSIPQIGRVNLGPPTSFTVRPQPGQLTADFEAEAPRIASAMGVPAVRVRPLAAEWIVIELLDAPTRPQHATAPQVVPFVPPRGTPWEYAAEAA
jgi:hypothetical protein